MVVTVKNEAELFSSLNANNGIFFMSAFVPLYYRYLSLTSSVDINLVNSITQISSSLSVVPI